MKITPNFDSREFDTPGNPWPDGYDANRAALADLLQWLRDLAGCPGRITSASRSKLHNDAVGGTEDSQHMKQEAVDVVFLLCPIRTLAERVLASVRAGKAPKFGQIIFYADKGHVHVSLATLGDRNGEIRRSYTEANGTRRYPFLSSASTLPMLSDAQVKAGVATGAGLGVLLFVVGFLAVAPSLRA